MKGRIAQDLLESRSFQGGPSDVAAPAGLVEIFRLNEHVDVGAVSSARLRSLVVEKEATNVDEGIRAALPGRTALTEPIPGFGDPQRGQQDLARVGVEVAVYNHTLTQHPRRVEVARARLDQSMVDEGVGSRRPVGHCPSRLGDSEGCDLRHELGLVLGEQLAVIPTDSRQHRSHLTSAQLAGVPSGGHGRQPLETASRVDQPVGLANRHAGAVHDPGGRTRVTLERPASVLLEQRHGLNDPGFEQVAKG